MTGRKNAFSHMRCAVQPRLLALWHPEFGPALRARTAARWLADADRDGDGRATLDEFIAQHLMHRPIQPAGPVASVAAAAAALDIRSRLVVVA